MTKEFDGLYSEVGRPSIAPERLLRALLLQVFYSVRSERLLMEQLNYNLLFPLVRGIRDRRGSVEPRRVQQEP
jgi:transposase